MNKEIESASRVREMLGCLLLPILHINNGGKYYCCFTGAADNDLVKFWVTAYNVEQNRIEGNIREMRRRKLIY